jgi:uncharacterized protein YaaR (DUF327 family)
MVRLRVDGLVRSRGRKNMVKDKMDRFIDVFGKNGQNMFEEGIKEIAETSEPYTGELLNRTKTFKGAVELATEVWMSMILEKIMRSTDFKVSSEAPASDVFETLTVKDIEDIGFRGLDKIKADSLKFEAVEGVSVDSVLLDELLGYAGRVFDVAVESFKQTK